MGGRRSIPKAIKIEVLQRDQWHCQFSNCRKYLTEFHHVKYIRDDGPTIPKNLVTLCPFHHRMVHKMSHLDVIKKWRDEITKQLRKPKISKYPVHVRSPESKDFKDAIRLYSATFPAEELDKPEDITRWFIENELLEEACKNACSDRCQEVGIVVEELLRQLRAFLPRQTKTYARELKRLYSDRASFERYLNENIRLLVDYFWVNRTKGTVDGVLYYWYYFKHRMAFVGYIISKNKATTVSLIGKALIGHLKNVHPECEAIIGELDDPRFMKPGRERRKAEARIRLFCQNGGRILYGAYYHQPRIRPNKCEKEIPLLLTYCALKEGGDKQKYLTKEQYERILEYVYISIYGDAFITKSGYIGYLRYLKRLKKRVLARSKNRIILGTKYPPS